MIIVPPANSGNKKLSLHIMPAKILSAAARPAGFINAAHGYCSKVPQPPIPIERIHVMLFPAMPLRQIAAKKKRYRSLKILKIDLTFYSVRISALKSEDFQKTIKKTFNPL
jgi:hypothetical protein